MNYLHDFKNFYLGVVLPNNPSYFAYFNPNNFDKNIVELIDNFEKSYGLNPFEIDATIGITKLISQKKEPFFSYSYNKGTDVPQSILNKHYSLFLEFNKTLEFANLQELIELLHHQLGNNFIKKFQKERIHLNGNSKIASSTQIFGPVRNDYWTINKGSERELQYHIYKRENEIGYGFGFNAQKSQNNLEPIENVSPFIKSFLLNKSEIEKKLQDYSFIYGTIDDLKNIKEGDFIIFGKKNNIEVDATGFKINGLSFLDMVYNLKNKQFNTYQLIYKNSKKANINSSQVVNMLESKSVLEYKKQIILQGPPGTGKTKLAKEIAANMLELDDVNALENNEQFKLIQFHPSYAYEDFVRGIVAKPKDDGAGIVYEAENKTLGTFAKEALKNYKASIATTSTSHIELWIDATFEDFKNEIEKEIEEKEIQLSGDVTLYKVEHDCFRYGKNWNNPSRINFADLKHLIKAIIENKFQVSNQPIAKELSVHAHYRYTYYNALLKIFFNKYQYKGESYTVSEKKYVLIIDEINRANLSSVLGELIYALEYRGKHVESMYDVDGKDLTLSPNLYIIGTMNTADRSVGHIDYAIRRRFAFVDVLPENLKQTQGLVDFNEVLFEKVAQLFKHITSDFEVKDVQLGHSYFIDKSVEPNGVGMNIRWNYEIKPILLEYIKDGILKESARVDIAAIDELYA